MSILKKPLVTEKYTKLNEKLKHYAFIVDRKATKEEIKAELEKVYDVTIGKVRTMVYDGKTKVRATRKKYIQGKTSGYKKAIVTLKNGEIDFYTNV